MSWKRVCSPISSYSIFDFTRCYGHREAYDMPREVTERFEASAVSKLAKNSLKDPLLKKEYARVKKSIKEGMHPMVYESSLPANYHLNVETGDAAIYNEDG